MTWFRVDDGFAEHPKVEALEDDAVMWAKAIAVWTVAGLYASRNATDGHVAAARLRRLTPFGPKVDAIAAELVRVGLFDKTDTGYKVHDFLDCNPTADEVEIQRTLARVRQQRLRERRRNAALAALGIDPASVTRDAPGDDVRDVTDDVTRDIPRDECVTDAVTHDEPPPLVTPPRPDPARPGPSIDVVVVPTRARAKDVLEGGDSQERAVTAAQVNAGFEDGYARPLGKWHPRYSELEPFSPYELKCAWLATQRACEKNGSDPNPGLYLNKLEDARREPPPQRQRAGPKRIGDDPRSGYFDGSKEFAGGEYKFGQTNTAR